MQQRDTKVPSETKGILSPYHQKNETIAQSYDEEADEIMRWGNWYQRRGNETEYQRHKSMAEARREHAKKLRRR